MLIKFYDLAKMPQGLVCSIRDNVKCYYDAVVRVENVDFIISTLWAKIPLEEAYLTESGISDFQRILYNGEILTWNNFNQENDKCFRFIQKKWRKVRRTYCCCNASRPIFSIDIT
jgi:hypothetical protein